MPVLFQLKDHFKENQLFLNRTVAGAAVVFIMLMILIIRLVYLQIHQYDMYSTLSRKNQVSILPIPPTRGLIYDRNGILLAENVPSFSLEITRKRIADLDETLTKLNELIPLSESDIESFHKQKRFKRHSEGVTIKTKLTEEEVARFSVEKYRFPGVDVVAGLIRHYPHHQDLAHALGYVGPISEHDLKRIEPANYRGTQHIGKAGLEYSYEALLHGEIGYKQVETDVRGRIVRVLDYTPPKPGKNLHLTLDLKLQQAATTAMGDQPGALVAIDPKTGSILALVSNPSFDPNIFVQGVDHKTYHALQTGKSQPMFNRALRGQYPPASTVKPLVALKGLETGVISSKTHIFDPGWYQLNEDGRLYRDWKPTGHGWMNLEKAITESCTTFFYHVSHKLGITPIHEIYQAFGLGQKTGIDIIGEAVGLTPSREWKETVKKRPWYTGETLNVGIGQGYTLATPVQVASVAMTIANRGERPVPHLVHATSLETEEPVSVHYPPGKKVVLKNPAHWSILIRAMEQVTKNPKGTARKIYRKEYSVAGKTGTAQVYTIKQDERYHKNEVKAHLRDHSWFMAFAPSDKPKIALAVILEHNSGSALIAKEIFDQYFGVS